MFPSRSESWPAYGASLLLHAALLASLALINLSIDRTRTRFLLDSHFSDEEPLRLDVEPELLVDSGLAETWDESAGQAVALLQSSNSMPAISREKVQQSESLRRPDLNPSLSTMPVLAADSIALELGRAQASGEVAAFVDGYGSALDRMMHELVRIMRRQRALVVWLFDESGSMKDDQREIREQLQKMYGNPGFNPPAHPNGHKEGDVLLTAIHGFGSSMHVFTPRATADLQEIRSAIGKISVDSSGVENVFEAIQLSIDKYYKLTARQERRLVIVVVTDESGDDGQRLEEVIDRARRFNVPVYFMGREAVFGYKYVHVLWRDPKLKLPHWLRINRGPETPFPEALQFDGLHERWDVYSSGFGSYAQVRLANQTGGIFFVLPGTEEDLIGRRASIARRQFDFLDMQEYLPQLDSKATYAEDRSKSPFRTAIAKVIEALDPDRDNELKLREQNYSIEPAAFRQEAQRNFNRGLRAMRLLQESIRTLEAVVPLREREAFQRWRANYDLIFAQCLAYRVRLFQFLLALDQHAKRDPRPKDPKNNVWSVRRRHEMLEPDAEQIKLTNVDMDELTAQESRARELLQFVIDTHPRTPWARVARHELNQGFGIELQEDYFDPKYAEFAQSGMTLPNF